MARGAVLDPAVGRGGRLGAIFCSHYPQLLGARGVEQGLIHLDAPSGGGCSLQVIFSVLLFAALQFIGPLGDSRSLWAINLLLFTKHLLLPDTGPKLTLR